MSTAKKPRKTSKKRIADVEEPGTSAPSETSKPVIVTNRPVMKDPMVKKAGDDDDESEDAAPETPPIALTSSSNKPKLQPLADSVLTQETEAAEKADKGTGTGDDPDAPQDEVPAENDPTVPASEKTAADSEDAESATEAAAEQTKESQPDQAAGQAAPWESAAAQDPAADADKQKSPAAKQAEAEAAERAKHDEAVRNLIEGRQYFLPINTIEQRQTKKVVIAGVALSVILVLFWVDIALDAGIIHAGGLHSITHFFSN